MNSLLINDRVIGPEQAVYIIAEMSANHNQSYEEAEKLVRAAADCGANAIKLQTYTPDTMTIPCDRAEFQIGKGTIWEGRNLYELYGEAYTPWDWQPRLKTLAESLGLHCFSTPFDDSSVDFLEEMNVPAYKIASFELIDHGLLRKVAATGKPVILSTGMASFEEIEEAVGVLRKAGCQELALLKCTSAYPSPPEEMHLRTIPDLAESFDLPVGLSDHTLGIAVPVAAISVGACIVEKHFTLSRRVPGPDSVFSLEPDEFRAMVDAVRAAEQAFGAITYELTDREEGSKAFRRSLVVTEDVSEGEAFCENNVRCIRPGYGLAPKHLPEVLGATAARNVSRGTPLAWNHVSRRPRSRVKQSPSPMSIHAKPAILGGKPIRSEAFPPRVTMGSQEVRAAVEVLENDVLSAFIASSGRFFRGGAKVQNFEDLWADAYGFKHAISVNSWTAGLVTCIGAVGIEPGDEVICSPYTMSASATCALFYGGIPVFADIEPATFGLDPASVEARITERTKAIVLVHLFGCPADIDAILEIARPRGIRVIEDAAQAPGVYSKGRAVGAIGDLGGFSLNFHKHIHTGEGGMIVTNDDDLAERCRLIRNHGENAVNDLSIDDIANTIGSNYRLTELQAAIGIEQIKRLSGILETRGRLARRLDEQLADIEGLTPHSIPTDCSHAYYVYPIRFDRERIGMSRHLFLKAVLAEMPEPEGYEGTALTEGYIKPLYLSPLYQQKIAIGSKGFPFTYNPGVEYDYGKGLCPVAERMYESELLLSPIVREPLSEDDIDDLADAIEKVAYHAREIQAAFPGEGGEIFTPVNAAVETDVR